MVDIKMYTRPLTGFSVAGSKARVTPGVIAKVSNALYDTSINVQCISSGEYSITVFIDQADAKKAAKVLKKVVITKTAFEALIVKSNVAMISATGKEFVNAPGMLERMIHPLGKAKIDILSVSTSFDSVVLLINWKDRKKAFKLIEQGFIKGRI